MTSTAVKNVEACNGQKQNIKNIPMPISALSGSSPIS
jgi:hypothetical protein